MCSVLVELRFWYSRMSCLTDHKATFAIALGGVSGFILVGIERGILIVHH